jgi:hypothetical protein
MTLDVKADGAYDMVGAGHAVTGTWQHPGGRFGLTPADNPKDVLWFKIDGNFLRPDVKPDSLDSSLVFRRK